MLIHIWPSEHWIDDEAYAEVVDVASRAEQDIRTQLPALAQDLYLLVNQTDKVIPETGDGGFTIGPHCIRWDVDPARGVAAIARAHLRATLFHECHHAVRLQRLPQEAHLGDWATIVVFEGLASVFEDEAGGTRADYRNYDVEVIADWAEELLSQPIDDTWTHWKFDHPDGRRSIAYKVGAWIADRATAATGRTAADMVWDSPTTVIEAANLPH